MSPRGWVCLAAATLALAGCGGGTLGPHAFTKDVESIQSLAAEGALVARQVAHGEATQPFLRVHTAELEQQASSLERRLSTARVPASLAGRRRRAVLVAAEVERDLGRLHADPGDRAAGRRLSTELERAAEQAERLAR
jgi:hypothetical protein